MAMILDSEKKELRPLDVNSIFGNSSPNNHDVVSDLDKINMILDRVNTLLNNPLVNQILGNLFNKFVNTQQQIPQRQNVEINDKEKELKAQEVMDTLKFILNNLNENMTVKDLKDEIQKNEQKIKETLKSVV